MISGNILAAFEMDPVNSRTTLKMMDGQGDLTLNHRGLQSARNRVDPILATFKMKLQATGTIALDALADAVRYLDGQMGQIALMLVDDDSNLLDQISRRFRRAWPQWQQPSDFVPLIEVRGRDDEDFPFELLPLLDASRVTDLVNYAEAEDALRRFLGFGTAVRRTIGEQVQTEGLQGTPKLAVQFLNYAMSGTATEGSYFGESLGQLDVEGPWPVPGLGSECVTERLIDALHDPMKSLDGKARRGMPVQIQHFACHCRTANQTDSGYALVLGGPKERERSVTLGAIGSGFRERNQRLGRIDGPRPLVIANACGSAKIDKESRRSFHRWFLRNHHRGFVGTETDIPDAVAADFGVRLYQELLQKKPLGEAVVMARRRLLTERGSPLGLLYVLYGDPALAIQ